MNKKALAAIIIASAIIIGVISMISWNPFLAKSVNDKNTGTQPTNNTVTEPTKAAGKHFTLVLNESVGVVTKP